MSPCPVTAPVSLPARRTHPAARGAARTDRLLGRTIGLTAVLMAVLVLAAWAPASPLLLFFTTAEFAGRAERLAPIVLALAIFQRGQLHALKGPYHNVPSIYFRPKAVQALALALFRIPLAMRYGLGAMVAAPNASSLLYLGAVVLANRRLSPADQTTASSGPELPLP